MLYKNALYEKKMISRTLRKAVGGVITAVITGISAFGASVLGIYGENHSSIGIYIKDLQADTIVFESEADRIHTPASVMKVVTAASAMSFFDSQFRFETKVYYTGTISKNGTLYGDLIIKASGDPTLESEHFPKQKGFIKDIVRAVKEVGISGIHGDIVLGRVNEDHDYAEGPLEIWESGDTPWAYGCGIFDFNYADNYFGIFPATGRTVPHVPGIKYEVWSDGWKSGLDMMRGIYSDSLIIFGKDYATNKKARINTSMPYPFDIFRYALKAALSEADIQVAGKRTDAVERKLLLTHRSARLDEILRSLMIRSDNMFAEGVLRVFGNRYGDRYNSIKTELTLWAERGLETDFVTIHDGSGLSRADGLSPRFLGNVLEWMARSDMSNRYVSLFPVAGVNGTMKNFMSDTPLKGRLALKTGSMSAVQTFAGYLLDENDKPTHVVVIMANDFFCSRKGLRAAISDFLLNTLNIDKKR